MRTAGRKGHALHLLLELLPVLDKNHPLPGLPGPVGAAGVEGGGLRAGSWDLQGPVVGLPAAPKGMLCYDYLMTFGVCPSLRLLQFYSNHTGFLGRGKREYPCGLGHKDLPFIGPHPVPMRQVSVRPPLGSHTDTIH